MAVGVCLRAGRAAVVACCLAAMVLAPADAGAQNNGVFKVAYYNIKSGKGQIGLHGTRTFTDTSNCTDPVKPLNAWGVGLVQQHLIHSLRDDPAVVALGLGEAWASVCGSPENVRRALNWKSRTSERNGVAMVAKHGFSGPETWLQLDTSLNTNPADTKWVLRMNVCLNAACSQTIPVYTAHWAGSGSHGQATYDRQAQQTAAFLKNTGGDKAHVLVGDLNVWEGTGPVCSQHPNNVSLNALRTAGYVDAWPLLHGTAEGFTGMVNRNGCGNPMGYTWKRIDYAWSPASFQPLSIERFGVVAPGIEAPSDHYGIIAAYANPFAQAPPDATAPVVRVIAPGDSVHAVGTPITIAIDATDDVGVARVDVLVNGAVVHSLASAPYQVVSPALTSAAGTHLLTARAYDEAGNVGASDVVRITVDAPAPPPSSIEPGTIVLHTATATMVAGNWQLVADTTAASGMRMWNPDLGLAKLNTAFAQPADYFEISFHAQAGVAYRVWMRGRADKNHWNNDSAFFQFSGSVTATGAPIYRIGTTSATWLGVERCSGCPLRNWGWNDNGYGAFGPLVYFASTGQQTLRVQRREDGISIDQIVLSPSQYLSAAPGLPVDDQTILQPTGAPAPAPAPAPPPPPPPPPPAAIAPTPPPPPSYSEILMTSDSVTALSGGWRVISDTTAAGGQAFGHPDAGAPKLAAALAAPIHYVELTFHAEAGRAYRLWIRGRADANSWANDSVFVQFDSSLTAAGQPVARIGTTGSYSVNLEEDVNWGVSGWGWQDNGYGANVLGPLVRFAATGPQTIRIQTREDGLRIDQVVLSSEKYLTSSPGLLKNDGTILK